MSTNYNNQEIRFAQKHLKCQNCYTHFKKLLPIDAETTDCINCSEGSVVLDTPNEFNRESLNRPKSMIFDKRITNNSTNEINNSNHTNNNLNTNTNRVPEVRKRVLQPFSNANQNTTSNTRINENIYGNNRQNSNNNQQTNNNVNNDRHNNTNNNNNGNGRTTRNNNSNFQNFFNPNELFSHFANMNNNNNVNENRNNGEQNPIINMNFNFFAPFGPNNSNQNTNGNDFEGMFNSQPNMFGAFPGMNNIFSGFGLIFTGMNQDMNQPQGTPPASEKLIDSVHKIKMNSRYTKLNDKNEMEYPTCHICLVETAKDEDCFVLPCEHVFHSGCIEQWLKLHNNCPVCRSELSMEKIIKHNKDKRKLGNRNDQ